MELGTAARHRAAADCLLLCALCVVVYFYGMGRMQLWREEPRRALVAREMMASGDWIVSTVNGKPYLSKPPGLPWLIALCSLPGGRVTETTARLPTAIAVVGTVLLVYWLGRSLLSRRAGLLAAAMTATTGLMLEKGVTAEIDGCFTFWVTGALFFLFRAAHGARGSRWDWPAAYAFLAMAFLTKGPPAFLFFFGTLVGIVCFHRGRGAVATIEHLYGAALFVVMVGTWLVPFCLRIRLGPLADMLRVQVFGRATRSGGWNPLHVLFYYPVSIAAGFLPWTPFLLAAFIALRHHRERQSGEDAKSTSALAIEYPPRGWPARKQLVRLLLTAVVAGVALFSLASARSSRYVLPIYPCLALLAGEVSDRFLAVTARPWLARFGHISLLGIHVVLAFAVAVGVPLAVLKWAVPYTAVVAFACLAVMTAVIGCILAHRRRYAWSLAALVVFVCAYRIAWVHVAVPEHNRRHSIAHIIRPLRAAIPEDADLYTVSYARHRIFFYLDRRTCTAESVGDLTELSRTAGAGKVIYCLLTESEAGELTSLQPDAWQRAFAFTHRDENLLLLATAPAAGIDQGASPSASG